MEFMMLLAISFTVIVVIFLYGTNYMTQLNKQKAISTAQNSVNDLVAAANTVYYQGVGNKKKVFYIVPDGIDNTKSAIVGKAIRFHVLNTDVFAVADVNLTGSLDLTPGGHWVWVEAKEGYVQIGTQLVTANRSSVYVQLVQNSSEVDSIIFENSGSENASVSISLTWNHSDVTVQLSDTSFILAPSGQKQVDVNFTAGSNAAGNYAGSLTVTSTIGSSVESLFIPLNAEVIVSSSGQAILLTPATWDSSTLIGDSNSTTFTICNATQSTLTNITFSFTGDAASWFSSVSPISSLAGESCTERTVSYTIPAGTYEGSYSATLTASTGSYSDSSTLNITALPNVFGEWSFNESSWSGVQGEVTDSSGYGGHGTAYGDATTTANAVSGRAGSFDGSGDYVEIPDSNRLDISGNLTINVWAYPKSWNDNAYIIKKGTNAYEIYITSSQKIVGKVNSVTVESQE
jgi:hypothetical protein